MQRVPMPSQTPSPVSEGEADAAEGEDQADERAEVLQEDDGQLGGLGAADELASRTALPRSSLDSLMAVRKEKRLGDDREDEDADRPVPVLDLVRVLDLLVALVDARTCRRRRTGRWRRGRRRCSARGRSRRGAAGWPRAWPSCRRAAAGAWLPESASECTPSASIDDEPLKTNATNFATAIARLAPSAATIALVPPDALMCSRCPFARASRACRLRRPGFARPLPVGHCCSPVRRGASGVTARASGDHGGPEDRARRRTPRPSRPAGTKTDSPRGVSVVLAARGREPAVQSRICGVRGVRSCGARARGRGRSGRAGTRRWGSRRPPRRRGTPRGAGRRGRSASKRTMRSSSGTSTCLGVRPQRRTLSELAMISTPRPSR